MTVARLVPVSVRLPDTRIPVFRTPSPSGSIPCSPDGPAASGDRRPSLETQGPNREAVREARSPRPPINRDLGNARRHI